MPSHKAVASGYIHKKLVAGSLAVKSVGPVKIDGSIPQAD